MKKNTKKIVVAVLLGCMLTGCGTKDASDTQTTEEGQVDGANAGDSVVEGVGDVVEDVADVVMEPLDLIPGMPGSVTTQASESDRHPELESLIQSRYEIGDEDLAGTRYYYNTMDLNADGTDEMIAVVMGDGIDNAAGNGGNGTGAAGNGAAGTDAAGTDTTGTGTTGTDTAGTDTTGTGTAGTDAAGTGANGTDSTGTGNAGMGQNTGAMAGGNLLVLTNSEGTWQIMQEFEGIGGPVIVSDTVTNGYRDLIVMNSNGTNAGTAGVGGTDTTGTGDGAGNGIGNDTGNNTENGAATGDLAATDTAGDTTEDTAGNGTGNSFLRLVYENGQYSEIETAEVLNSIDNLTGTALLYNDVQGDYESGDYMSLGTE